MDNRDPGCVLSNKAYDAIKGDVYSENELIMAESTIYIVDCSASNL